MRFDVRDPLGTLLGSMDIHDIRLFEHRSIRFAHALDIRHYGSGLLQALDESVTDPSFQTLDLKVGMWTTLPTIGTHGGYYPGRVDFTLIHSRHPYELHGIRDFTPAP